MINLAPSKSCPFCSMDISRVLISNQFAIATADAFPVSEGHALIIPRRHISSIFEATEEELAHIFKLVAQTRVLLNEQFQPQGLNIGINDGVAAGQTVMHLHIHLIPRYKGDQSDPRGGVRWIFPDKAQYW
jgi:diadenosine tetraphosphate (Ap4A) HIT family hydrolase